MQFYSFPFWFFCSFMQFPIAFTGMLQSVSRWQNWTQLPCFQSSRENVQYLGFRKNSPRIFHKFPSQQSFPLFRICWMFSTSSGTLPPPRCAPAPLSQRFWFFTLFWKAFSPLIISNADPRLQSGLQSFPRFVGAWVCAFRTGTSRSVISSPDGAGSFYYGLMPVL